MVGSKQDRRSTRALSTAVAVIALTVTATAQSYWIYDGTNAQVVEVSALDPTNQVVQPPGCVYPGPTVLDAWPVGGAAADVLCGFDPPPTLPGAAVASFGGDIAVIAGAEPPMTSTVWVTDGFVLAGYDRSGDFLETDYILDDDNLLGDVCQVSQNCGPGLVITGLGDAHRGLGQTNNLWLSAVIPQGGGPFTSFVKELRVLGCTTSPVSAAPGTPSCGCDPNADEAQSLRGFELAPVASVLPATAQVTDVAHDPWHDCIWVCTNAGGIMRYDADAMGIVAPCRTYLAALGPNSIPGLSIDIQGIDVDLAASDADRTVLVVTDRVVIARVEYDIATDTFGAIETFTFPEQTLAQPVGVVASGLAYDARPLEYGSQPSPGPGITVEQAPITGVSPGLFRVGLELSAPQEQTVAVLYLAPADSCGVFKNSFELLVSSLTFGIPFTLMEVEDPPGVFTIPLPVVTVDPWVGTVPHGSDLYFQWLVKPPGGPLEMSPGLVASFIDYAPLP